MYLPEPFKNRVITRAIKKNLTLRYDEIGIKKEAANKKNKDTTLNVTILFDCCSITPTKQLVRKSRYLFTVDVISRKVEE